MSGQLSGAGYRADRVSGTAARNAYASGRAPCCGIQKAFFNTVSALSYDSSIDADAGWELFCEELRVLVPGVIIP